MKLCASEIAVRFAGVVAIDRTGAATLRRGQKLLLRGSAAPVEGPAYTVCLGTPVAVGVVEEGYFVSTRVFNLGG